MARRTVEFPELLQTANALALESERIRAELRASLTTLRESRKPTQQLCEPPLFVRQTGWLCLSSLDHTGPEPPLLCNALDARHRALNNQKGRGYYPV
jgi:hypothetical protein